MRLESLIRGSLLRFFHVLTCDKVEGFSYDFLEERLHPARMMQIRVHLLTCPKCLRFMKTYRKTKELGAHMTPPALPPEFKDAMLQFLMAEQAG